MIPAQSDGFSHDTSKMNQVRREKGGHVRERIRKERQNHVWFAKNGYRSSRERGSIFKKVLRNFRYGLIYDISSVGVCFTSVFRYCVLPCPGGWPGPGG